MTFSVRIVKRKLSTRFVAALLGLFIGWFCSACTKSVPVPSDCQIFLDKYFEAVKSRDVGQLQDFSSYISRTQSKGMPEEGMAMMRESKRKYAAEGFERVSRDFGDFQSYSVLSVKETTITADELAAKKMQEIGLEEIHTEIVSKAKFSKKHPVLIDLRLFKETPKSPYSIEAWQYQAAP
jgi:hypothetical protein